MKRRQTHLPHVPLADRFKAQRACRKPVPLHFQAWIGGLLEGQSKTAEFQQLQEKLDFQNDVTTMGSRKRQGAEDRALGEAVMEPLLQTEFMQRIREVLNES